MNKLTALFKKKNAGSGRLPSKRSMNLYVKVKDGNSWQVLLPLAVFLVLVVFFIYRLGVVDRLNKLNSIRHDNAQLEAELNTLNEELSKYTELEEEYRRYTTGYLREEERGLLKRSRIFEMLEECTADLAVIKNVSIENNQVGLVVDIASLNDIETIQDRLNEMPNVDEIKVSTAKGTNNVEVEGYIIFTVKRSTDSTGTESDGSLSAEERASKLQEYSQAAIDARNAEEESRAQASAGVYGTAQASSGSSQSQTQRSSSASSGGAQSSASNAGSTAGSGSTSSQGTSGSAASQATTQTVNGDEVVSYPPGVFPGFATLEEGMAQLEQQQQQQGGAQ